MAELSERIDVKLSVQESGTYNLSIGNGQPLVAGTRSFELEAVESKTDPSRLVVGYHDSAGNLVELKSKNIQGGSLGGLLNFREETLDKTQNELGRLAVSLAQAFNEQHRDGVDLNGDAGGDLFAIGSPRLYSHADNTGTATLSVAFGDAEGLTTSDYTVTVVDPATGEFAITRNDNGETVNATLDANNQLSFGGVVVTIDDPAQLAANDRFEVQPTRYAAGGMEMLIRDTAEIAAGSAAGSGNNENALALQELQNQSLVSGNATFSQAYASLVGDVGNRTNIVKVNLAAQQGLQEQLSAVQQSVSGVDLNEEAANLIRFQQYFQANAKVIEVGSTVLDSILGLR